MDHPIEIFPWNENFNTGIQVIDEQHKMLVALLNKLVSHLAFQSEGPELESVFNELKAYVEFHFDSEESIWEEAFNGDNWIKSHQQSHGNFVAEIIRIKENESKKDYDEVLYDIVQFLTHWLAQHILESDRRMAKVVLALPSGVSLERAKESANEEMAGSARVLIETLMLMYDKLADSTLSMSREIYKRQELEKQLRSAKLAAETANRAKSVFLANMSHEFRTPLNAILGFSDILRRDPTLTGVQHQNLEIIHKSGDHLLGLINDVLDLAKIEAGHIVRALKPFDLGAMVLDITDMLRIRAQDKGLQLLLDQQSEFPRYIVGDEAKLRQILINLIANAIKATEEGGVTLRLGLKHNHVEHLLIEVEDTGCGISAEDQAKLFQPFVQVGLQNKQEGTGLGLSITHHFVELMDGSISLTSTLGQGSTFRVEVRVQLAQPEDVQKAVKVQGEVTGLAPGQPLYRVLVVDDQEDNTLLLTRLLDSAGFEVAQAGNGAEAVEKFQHRRPHFIWMDRRMPVMDGVEATRRIRALPGGDKVKIAAVTASTFREEDDQLTAAGFDDIVHKPFRAEQIFTCMEKLLGVRFTRPEAEAKAATAAELSAEAMAALPEELRKRFALALSLLDSEHIMDTIDEIAKIDAELASALRGVAENYDYPTILAML